MMLLLINTHLIEDSIRKWLETLCTPAASNNSSQVTTLQVL